MYKLVKMSLLILVSIGLMSQSVIADSIVQQRITLNVENAKLITVLGELRKQSGCNFIYNEKFIRGIEGVTVKVKDSTLETALKESLKNTKLTYKVQDGIIVIVPKKAPAVQEKSKTVKGIVKDDKGNPLPGVTVILKGTTAGVSTDIDGRFSIEVTSAVKILSFSFIGMETKEVTIPKEGKELVVVLETKVDELDEVVVTGYTQTTKRKATGSVAVLKKEVFENKAVPTVDHLLQGQIAGVSTVARSGRPGESAKIRIRGTNTITGNAEPLWVVDGVALQKDIPKISTGQIKSGDFNDIFNSGIAGINPNDIESVTVLKDASAAAIYGSRAAGGVIVVTTKKGKSGKMRVSYSSTFSVVLKPQRDANLMNSKEKLAWEQELWDEYSLEGFNSGKYFPVVGITGMVRGGLEEFAGMTKEEQDSYLNGISNNTTDWFGELFRNSVSQNHYLSVSGGGDKSTYYVSGGYSDNNGLVKKTDYSRYNISAKVNLNPKDNFRIGFSVDMAKQQSNGPSMNADPFKYAYFANPYEKPYNEDGSYKADYTYYSLKRINGGMDIPLPEKGFNIIRELDETSSVADNFSGNLRMNLDYNFSDKFKFSGLASYSFTNNKTENINGKETYAAYSDRLFFDSYTSKRTYGSITQSSANNSSYSIRGQFSYTDNIGEDSRFSVLVGSEIRGQKAESIFAKRYGYDSVTGNSSIPIPGMPQNSDKIDYNDLKAYAAMVDGLSGQSKMEDRFASFYGSFDYYYTRKYVVSVSFRTDGSNNFGSAEQFNPTWSVGGAWHLMEEPFMESLSSIFSNLSLRLATGFTGNVNKTIYPQLVMNYSPYFRKTYEETYRMGSINNAPNPNLRWEKTKDYKLSLSYGLFDNRLSGIVETYYRLSTDVVTKVQVPYTTGYSSQGYNTSEIENRGIEFTLNSQIINTKDFKFGTSFNIAWNQNKLVKYDAPMGLVYGSNFVGYPLSSVFGGKIEGIDPETGIYKFKLRPDAQIISQLDMRKSENYMFYLGTSTAPYTGGFSLNLSYKSFGLNVGGSYSFGANILNEVESPVNYGTISKNGELAEIDNETIPTKYNDLYVSHLNVNKDVTDRWTEGNATGVKYPRIINYFGDRLFLDLVNPTYSGVTKGALLENVSFLRVRNISFSYSFNESFLKKIGVSSMGMNLTLNNFFTYTNYSGIDPETPGAVYPVTRSVSFGINVGF